MNIYRIVTTAALALLLAHTGKAQSARDYFNELYKAGGLDRMADEYVCFDDSLELQKFFIFSKSDTLKLFLMDTGAYAKLPKSQQSALNKGFLIVRGYDEGVALPYEETDSKDGSTWVSDTFDIQKTPMRMRFGLTWETMRYKRALEELNANSTLKNEYPRYGRCEAIPSDVRQKGN
jgi:hypothetical protein